MSCSIHIILLHGTRDWALLAACWASCSVGVLFSMSPYISLTGDNLLDSLPIPSPYPVQNGLVLGLPIPSPYPVQNGLVLGAFLHVLPEDANPSSTLSQMATNPSPSTSHLTTSSTVQKTAAHSTLILRVNSEPVKVSLCYGLGDTLDLWFKRIVRPFFAFTPEGSSS